MSSSKLLNRRAVLGSLSAGLALPFFSQIAWAQQESVLRPRIEEALRSLTTLQGGFIQIDTTSGSGQSGKFWISRPGRLRFEYETRPEMLVADGEHVARINTNSGNISKVRIASTPLRIVLSNEVDLTDGVTITRMEQTPDSLFVTLYERGKRNQGLITIFLDVSSYELRGWKIEENDGNVTTVILQETQRGVAIDPSAFVIEA